MTPPERLESSWSVAPAMVDPSLPQEIVTLTSMFSRSAGSYTSTAIRSWVTDLDGGGLEADQMDPVLILAAPHHPEVTLQDFHFMAEQELSRRRLEDFEVADLFVCDP